jgi:hypothetical protein
MSMRMHQPVAEFDAALQEELAIERALAEAKVRQAQTRMRRRHKERTQRQGTLRFILLFLVLLATAIGVTIAMFQTLYIVMG